MKILSSRVAVSDADVMIKLYKAGSLSLLGDIFSEVIVPGKVYEEVTRKINKQVDDINSLLENKWLKKITITDREFLNEDQIELIGITMHSFQHALDDGEREAFALANELNISILLIDDASAKRIIEHNSNVKGLSHVEVLYLAILKKIMTPQEAEKVFERINTVVTYPIKTPFSDLIRRAQKRFRELGLL
ncbi:MAG: hypothetical protein A4E52_00333 [Pelotomaculum sp. PtaB.Bin013]|uniref:DUF3368 domain-containing protein n=1 Tax=Pelotomaculum isophthalicicum JI TaxID=947010 RepID=A0A9X4GYY6_9FIRM|nr:hypothetical protein [Pelotomaculum isophthalicicum]MDF9408212.1 hypothetical protein [Pelotomaculum isophthalicicum JI]OPX91807.1 MAG: hypothetical protein A4E52_00333 [Pelotomaculum sp. PtaB.Bin013]